MSIKTNLVRLALVGSLALSGCGKIMNESEGDKSNSERGSRIIYHPGLNVRSGTNNVTFYDLLADGRLLGIQVNNGAVYDRNWKLPEAVKTINDNLGDAPDRLYSNIMQGR